jgi:hypothetical protein
VQTLTKETGVSLLITEPVRERVQEYFRIGREFSMDLRGKAGQHMVFDVLGPR